MIDEGRYAVVPHAPGYSISDAVYTLDMLSARTAASNYSAVIGVQVNVWKRDGINWSVIERVNVRNNDI